MSFEAERNQDIFDRPICDGLDDVDPPESLRPTFEASTFSHRSAGVWELLFPPTFAGAQASDDWLRVLLGDFLAAFPWLNIQSIEVSIPGRTVTWQDGDGLSLSNWLDALGSQVHRSFGFEAKLAACIHWADEQGRTERCILPGAVSMYYDQTSRLIGLEFWPNVFTDVVDVYPPDWRTNHRDGEPTSFRPAAARNREQLAASLHAIAARTGAEVIGVGSELLTGLVQFGFAEDASIH
jgi:hypothetical protein